jgi:hypothetical protein
MNNYTAIVNLGADPEPLTLGGKELIKLRLADKTPGKKSVTRWLTAMVGGPDLATAGRLAKGDAIMITGTLVKEEYKPNKPKYKGEMVETDNIPFAKILQVVKSETFFNTKPDTEVPSDAVANTTAEVTTGDFPVDNAASVATDNLMADL